MNVKIIYPQINKKKKEYRKIINIMKYPLIIATIICPILNIVTGGKAWSIIVLWSIYIFWKLIISPDLVEYNRISQFIKLILYSSILLTLIDIFLISGWAIEVVPNVIFCGLIISSILFFTDIEKQKQNMQPLLLLTLFSIISSIIGLTVYKQEDRWALAVMGGIALIILIFLIITLKEYLIKEIRKIFHTE